ncbi:hypothetical protein SARC_11007, partial [Sphaeroforma arctica JP610]
GRQTRRPLPETVDLTPRYGQGRKTSTSKRKRDTLHDITNHSRHRGDLGKAHALKSSSNTHSHHDVNETVHASTREEKPNTQPQHNKQQRRSDGFAKPRSMFLPPPSPARMDTEVKSNRSQQAHTRALVSPDERRPIKDAAPSAPRNYIADKRKLLRVHSEKVRQDPQSWQQESLSQSVHPQRILIDDNDDITNPKVPKASTSSEQPEGRVDENSSSHEVAFKRPLAHDRRSLYESYRNIDGAYSHVDGKGIGSHPRALGDKHTYKVQRSTDKREGADRGGLHAWSEASAKRPRKERRTHDESIYSSRSRHSTHDFHEGHVDKVMESEDNIETIPRMRDGSELVNVSPTRKRTQTLHALGIPQPGSSGDDTDNRSAVGKGCIENRRRAQDCSPEETWEYGDALVPVRRMSAQMQSKMHASAQKSTSPFHTDEYKHAAPRTNSTTPVAATVSLRAHADRQPQQSKSVRGSRDGRTTKIHATKTSQQALQVVELVDRHPGTPSESGPRCSIPHKHDHLSTNPDTRTERTIESSERPALLLTPVSNHMPSCYQRLASVVVTNKGYRDGGSIATGRNSVQPPRFMCPQALGVYSEELPATHHPDVSQRPRAVTDVGHGEVLLRRADGSVYTASVVRYSTVVLGSAHGCIKHSREAVVKAQVYNDGDRRSLNRPSDNQHGHWQGLFAHSGAAGNTESYTRHPGTSRHKTLKPSLGSEKIDRCKTAPGLCGMLSPAHTLPAEVEASVSTSGGIKPESGKTGLTVLNQPNGGDVALHRAELPLSGHGYPTLEVAGTVKAVSERRGHRGSAVVELGSSQSPPESAVRCEGLVTKHTTSAPLKSLSAASCPVENGDVVCAGNKTATGVTCDNADTAAGVLESGTTYYQRKEASAAKPPSKGTDHVRAQSPDGQKISERDCTVDAHPVVDTDAVVCRDAVRKSEKVPRARPIIEEELVRDAARTKQQNSVDSRFMSQSVALLQHLPTTGEADSRTEQLSEYASVAGCCTGMTKTARGSSRKVDPTHNNTISSIKHTAMEVSPDLNAFERSIRADTADDSRDGSDRPDRSASSAMEHGMVNGGHAGLPIVERAVFRKQAAPPEVRDHLTAKLPLRTSVKETNIEKQWSDLLVGTCQAGSTSTKGLLFASEAQSRREIQTRLLSHNATNSLRRPQPGEKVIQRPDGLRRQDTALLSTFKHDTHMFSSETDIWLQSQADSMLAQHDW